MWNQAEGRSYARTIRADGLITALMTAYVLRWPGLREIAGRMGRKFLGARNFSSLSHALSRAKVGAEYIILVTGEMRWSAERILNAYKKRERIERFHRFLKDSLGLSHLYNFSHTGLMVLLYTALLLALLLFLADGPAHGEETILALRTALKALHKTLGLGHRWKRNTNTIKRASSARKYKWQEQQNP